MCELMCPECGWKYKEGEGQYGEVGVVPAHGYQGKFCRGSDKIPRNPEEVMSEKKITAAFCEGGEAIYLDGTLLISRTSYQAFCWQEVAQALGYTVQSVGCHVGDIPRERGDRGPLVPQKSLAELFAFAEQQAEKRRLARIADLRQELARLEDSP